MRVLRHWPLLLSATLFLLAVVIASWTTNGSGGPCGSVMHPQNLGGSICGDHHLLAGALAAFLVLLGVVEAAMYGVFCLVERQHDATSDRDVSGHR